MIRSRKTGLSAVPQMYHEELVKRTKDPQGSISDGSVWLSHFARRGQPRSILRRKKEMQKNKKVLIIAAVVLILIAAALFFIEGSKKPVPIEGAKTITVTVMQEGVENKVFTIHTDAEFLRGALEQEKLVEGTESQYGLYVTTVDGVTADDSQRQYWCFKDGNGNDLTVGVDSAPIADGDAFQIVLSTY